MADNETKEWAEKTKRIEAERLKAVKSLENEKPAKANLAYLDPKTTKIKGWSNDSDVILASVERMGNRAIILAIAGTALSAIGAAGNMVVTANNLGLAGIIISGLPSSIGLMCIGIAVLMSLVALGAELIAKFKYGRKFTSTLWTSLAALAFASVYFLILRLM